MKKLILFFSLLTVTFTVNAQNGSDCNHAIAFANTSSCINNDTLVNQMWFSFVADQTSQIIQSTLIPGSPGHIHTMNLYSSGCNNSTLVDMVSINPNNDTLLTLNETGLTIGATYYISVTNQVQGCPKCVPNISFANFNLCLLITSPTFMICAQVPPSGSLVCCSVGVTCVLATVCAGMPVDLSTSASTGSGFIFTAPGGTLAGNEVTYTSPGTYNVGVSAGGSGFEYGTIVVVPSPTITVNSPTICVGQTATLIASGASGTYSWNTGETTSSINVTPTSTTSYTVTYTNGAGCTSTAVATVIVNPIPTVSAPANITVCNGTTVPVSAFIGTPVSATFSWTNSNTTIGLTASGTGNTPPFTATNTTSTPITGTITVTPILGSCVGTSVSYIITVNPSPIAHATPAFETICSGSFTGISLSSSIPGTTFSWIVTQTGVTGGAAGSGTNISQALSTTGSTAGTAVYTITPTAGGCPGRPITVTITVNPNPITIVPASFSVCDGASVSASAYTSTPSGATFTWTNSNPAIGLAASGTGNTPAFTATNSGTTPITGIISVTSTLAGCTGIPSTYTITVNPIPTVGALPNIKVCNGNTVGPITFTGTPAGEIFTWTNSNPAIGLAASGTGNIPPFAAINLSTTTPITAIITVTPSIGGCAGIPVSFIIAVLPSPIITISVIPASATIPLGGTAVLTATGAATYTWSTGSNADPLTVTPPVTTTYTVIGTNQYGCSSSAIQTITVVNPNCSITTINVPDGTVASMSSLFTGASVASVNFNIAGTLIIDKPFAFIDCKLLMASSSSNIQVMTNGVLRLEQATHLFSCTDMWDGIYVHAGCQIFTSGDVIIEDARQAINLPEGATGSIDQTIFNRNLIAIKLYPNNLTTTPVTIKNSVFTCRYIPTTPVAPGVITVKANLNLPMPTYSEALLLSPYSTQKGFAGIYAKDVKVLDIGNAALPQNRNIFDAIMVGIDLLNPTKPNTAATIYNNQFQYLLGYGSVSCLPPPALCPFEPGFGILAAGTNSSANNSIIVGGSSSPNESNIFYNIYEAISIKNYHTNKIINNSISNSSTGPFGFLTVNYGNGGIFVTPALSNSVVITNNSPIKNCATAIWVNHGAGSATTSSSLQIDNNGTASNPITSDGTPGAYCNIGIYVTDLVSSSTFPLLWSVSNNVITETNNCIFLSNVKKPAIASTVYNVFSNSCNTHYSSTGILTGIRTNGCKGINIIENHTNYTLGSTAYLGTGNITAYGLYSQLSTNMIVKCNLFENAGISMAFSGGCTSSTTAGFGITQNTMRRAQNGLVLLDNTAVIGQQGNHTVPSNNYWDMTAAGAPYFIHHTYSNSLTTNIMSQLYVNPILTVPINIGTKPTLNGGPGFYIPTVGIITTTNIPAPCTGTPPPALSTGGNNMNAADIVNYTGFLKTLEEDTTLLPMYNNETHWQQRKFVFSEVDDNPEYSINGALLNFYNTNKYTALGKFSQVDYRITLGEYLAANAINNSIIPSNIAESNQQTVNAQILQKLITPNYTYSENDNTVLYDISNQCPLQGGDAVYQARILLMTIAENVIAFNDNCDNNQTQKMSSIQPANMDAQSKPFKLYPNPNNGMMLLNYTLNTNDNAEMKIYDIAGKLISSYQINNTSAQMEIHDDKLNNGVYFYQIRVNDQVVQADKLIIIK